MICPYVHECVVVNEVFIDTSRRLLLLLDFSHYSRPTRWIPSSSPQSMDGQWYSQSLDPCLFAGYEIEHSAWMIDQESHQERWSANEEAECLPVSGIRQWNEPTHKLVLFPYGVHWMHDARSSWNRHRCRGALFEMLSSVVVGTREGQSGCPAVWSWSQRRGWVVAWWNWLTWFCGDDSGQYAWREQYRSLKRFLGYGRTWSRVLE